MKLVEKVINNENRNIGYYYSSKKYKKTILIFNGGPGQNYKYLLYNNIFEKLSKKNILFSLIK